MAGVEATLDWSPSSPASGGDGPRKLVVRARQVVLAAGALRSPAILTRSGFAHPAIGRNLRLHPVPVVAGRFADSIEMWHGVMQAARSTEYLHAEPGSNGYVIESAPGHPGLIALAFGWEGADAHATLMERVRSYVPLLAITRDGGEGRVSLSKGGSVRIDYALDASGTATLRHALVRMVRLLRAAGRARDRGQRHAAAVARAAGVRAGRRDPGVRPVRGASRLVRLPAESGALFSAHQMGSVRMGANPRTYPCDPAGRVRSGAG